MCKYEWLTNVDLKACTESKRRTIERLLQTGDAERIKEATATIDDLLLVLSALGQERQFFLMREYYAALLSERPLDQRA